MQHSDVNMIQLGIETCIFFSIFSGKPDSSEAKSCFEVDILFSSTNGSRSSKTSASENVKA